MALLPLLTFRKLINFLIAIFYFLIKSKKSVKHPPILILDLTNRCNFKCLMCSINETQTDHYMDHKNPKDMDFKVLENYLREHAKYLVLVRLHGGEPLLYENIVPLIDLLNELKIPFNIVTNGSLLTEEISKKLINSYCVGIGFSLDTSNPERFETIRKGGDFQEITANIDQLSKIKEENKSKRPVFSASMCAMSINVEDMTDLIVFCKNHKIPALSVGEVTDLETLGFEKSHLISENKKNAYEAIKKAVKEAKKQGIIFRLRFPSLSSSEFKDIPFHKGNILPKNCINLYAATWFLPDLRVIGCSASGISYGNLDKNDFQDIWNTPDYGYMKARTSFRTKNVPKGCEKCTYTGSFFS